MAYGSLRGFHKSFFRQLASLAMTLRGSEGLGCDTNTLFKAHLDFGRYDVDVWLAKLVHSTRPPIFLSQRPTFIANFCVS